MLFGRSLGGPEGRSPMTIPEQYNYPASGWLASVGRVEQQYYPQYQQPQYQPPQGPRRRHRPGGRRGRRWTRRSGDRGGGGFAAGWSLHPAPARRARPPPYLPLAPTYRAATLGHR